MQNKKKSGETDNSQIFVDDSFIECTVNIEVDKNEKVTFFVLKTTRVTKKFVFFNTKLDFFDI